MNGRIGALTDRQAKKCSKPLIPAHHPAMLTNKLSVAYIAPPSDADQHPATAAALVSSPHTCLKAFEPTDRTCTTHTQQPRLPVCRTLLKALGAPQLVEIMTLRRGWYQKS